ncbi:MAG: tRNA dihydrouridine synthase DusB [Melioribacteraceae bacterium]|nr:tRNA dihydrouridine synthase DusB [Melioribacteraceae bacterium]MCF8263970.1 tRNA dihydrouridine synthase DusB [Melioribacteraceae bacterium]MCF8411822.1 tRNA dihydrouridine synthase DusB [Melioribacteraceae bacterium]MCF8431809.1 tRNA dihydrouridine synthase DusB [Melioribacteraceae bacterium]
MKIGNIDLGAKQLLAPMAEVTDTPFRTIAKQNGAGLTFTQMVSARGVIDNEFETLQNLSFSNSEAPIGVQVLGNNARTIGYAVKEIARFKPALIDLNCGCPVTKVTKHNMGASLLNDTEKISSLVKSMVDNSDGIPISVKLRLGLTDRNINIIENANAVKEAGAALIFVHARTKQDRYDEEPDWNWLKVLKQETDIPIVGNGSIFTPQDIKEMLEQTKCDSVLVARGALGNPFIFSRYNALVETGYDPGPPDILEVGRTVTKHLDLLVQNYGEFKALPKTKKNIVWYFRNYDGISVLLADIFAINEIEQLKNYVLNHSEKIKENYFEKEDLEEIDEKFKQKVLFWLLEKKDIYEDLYI